MWSLAFALYIGCKWLTWRRSPPSHAPLIRHLGYFVAWPGLDAPAFLGSRPVPRPSRSEWRVAVGKICLGILILAFGVRWSAVGQPYLVGWIGMVGIGMVLHFGLFHLLSCAWRRAGVDAKPLMHWPLAATSVSDYWGRRWNTAFRDLTHAYLFRPLAPRIGARRAMLWVFVFSGLIHDLVISVPAGGGYGGPTLFFVIQAGALTVERSAWGKRRGLGKGVTGWAFTAGVLAITVPLLFHWPFVVGVVLPYLAALGAL